MVNTEKDDLDLNRKAHWEKVYSEKQSNEVSWYQQHPERSLELIKSTGIEHAAHIIDIGGGASTLIDYLIEAGFQNLTVLDISGAAINQAKTRLGDRADKVTWLEQDVTEFPAYEQFDIWHDRAVFHFLTDVLDRSTYVRTMSRALKIGGHAIIATFDITGPKQCSGLNVVRYSPETMSAVLGDSFQLVETQTEEHVTPSGSAQHFVYCKFIRVAQ